MQDLTGNPLSNVADVTVEIDAGSADNAVSVLNQISGIIANNTIAVRTSYLLCLCVWCQTLFTLQHQWSKYDITVV